MSRKCLIAVSEESEGQPMAWPNEILGHFTA
jgi:hypothetical protein